MIEDGCIDLELMKQYQLCIKDPLIEILEDLAAIHGAEGLCRLASAHSSEVVSLNEKERTLISEELRVPYECCGTGVSKDAWIELLRSGLTRNSSGLTIIGCLLTLKHLFWAELGNSRSRYRWSTTIRKARRSWWSLWALEMTWGQKCDWTWGPIDFEKKETMGEVSRRAWQEMEFREPLCRANVLTADIVLKNVRTILYENCALLREEEPACVPERESMPFLVEIGATPILASRYFLLLDAAGSALQRFT